MKKLERVIIFCIALCLGCILGVILCAMLAFGGLNKASATVKPTDWMEMFNDTSYDMGTYQFVFEELQYMS